MKTPANIYENRTLHNCTQVFENRADAGGQLAELLRPHISDSALMLAIPAGGYPVAAAISKSLNLSLGYLVASKLLVPGHTEVGFGAVAFDGSEWLNLPLIDRLNLTQGEIEQSRQQALAKVQRRFARLCNNQPPKVMGRQVILVDDGLASGATLYAAITALRKRQPAELVVAVPTGSEHSVQAMAPQCDNLVCANIRSGYPYAVAHAYRHWVDVDEAELPA